MATLYGIAPVLECLRHRRRERHRLYVKEGKPNPRTEEILSLAEAQSLRVEAVSPQRLADRTQSGNHQGVALEVGELEVQDLDGFLEAHRQGSFTLVALDQIEDPQNLGSIVRSAAFLGAQGLVTSRTRSSPLSPAASKASAGALEFFPVVVVPNLAQALTRLDEEFVTLVGADSGSTAVDYSTVQPSKQQVLVLGNEGKGLRALTKKRCHHIVRIPGGPHPDSLNVGVSAGVLLAHFLRFG